MLADEYPSGIYTWRDLARETGAEVLTVEPEPGQAWTEAILAALDERVALVCVPNVHWTDGALIDLDAVAQRARALGCKLVVDASQSAGAMPLDVESLRPDYLVAVGYKWLLGPFALSYLYVAPSTARAGRWSRTGSCVPARGLRPAGRLPRRLPARGAALRYGPANELPAGADGDRRSRAAPGMEAAADRRDARRPERRARGAPWRDGARAAPGRTARPAHAGRRAPGGGQGRSAGGAGRRGLLRRRSRQLAAHLPHLHNTPEEAERLADALAATVAG